MVKHILKYYEKDLLKLKKYHVKENICVLFTLSKKYDMQLIIF
jgi:hypothetical protein